MQVQKLPSVPEHALVVVADDDAFQRAYTTAVLRKLGYEAVEACDGLEALELVRQTQARILVCDLDMPGLDGHALARRVRAEFTEYYVHILMLTGQEQSQERERALDAGVDDFMRKPLDTVTLRARIRTADRLMQHEILLAERSRVLEEAKEQIEADLRAAAAAQARMLPPSKLEVGDCIFHSAFKPSNFLSGDMYACYDIAPGYIGFYAIDVAGHGVHASLLSVALGHLVTPAMFRDYGFDEAGEPDPAALVETLNRRFYRDDSTEYFTMFCAILEYRTGLLHYCQAGYPSPLIMARSGRARIVGDGGFPVALLDTAEFETAVTQFAEDEMLVMFSDGASEAENPDGIAFSEGRVEAVAAGSAMRPGDIPARIVAALTDWRSGQPLDDDLTVLVCERKALA